MDLDNREAPLMFSVIEALLISVRSAVAEGLVSILEGPDSEGGSMPPRKVTEEVPIAFSPQTEEVGVQEEAATFAGMEVRDRVDLRDLGKTILIERSLCERRKFQTLPHN